MPRGGKRPGAGNKLGNKNRYSKALAEKMHKTGFTEPLDILMMMANDPALSADLRIKAAQNASPYVHKRKPQALEVTGKFEFLSPEEREMRRKLLIEEMRARATRKSAPADPSASDQ